MSSSCSPKVTASPPIIEIDDHVVNIPEDQVDPLSVSPIPDADDESKSVEDDDEESEADENIGNSSMVEDISFVENVEPTEAPAKLMQLPISRIKAIAKLVPSVQLVNSEAIMLIGKATEQFIAELITETKVVTIESGKKTITKAHLDQLIQQDPKFEFLDGMLT